MVCEKRWGGMSGGGGRYLASHNKWASFLAHPKLASEEVAPSFYVVLLLPGTRFRESFAGVSFVSLTTIISHRYPQTTSKNQQQTKLDM